MLKKQNSAFTTSFISEAGIKLENNDYCLCGTGAVYADGDTIMEKGALESAEKKCLAAKSLLVGIHFKEGRRYHRSRRAYRQGG